MKISNLIVFLILFAIVMSFCFMNGYSCGKRNGIGMEQTVTVIRKVLLPKITPIDSFGIFDKFRRKLRIPKIRYVDVIRQGDVQLGVTDTMSVIYGMYFGILDLKFRSGLIHHTWFTVQHDTATDSTTTIIGKDTLVELSNPRSNYDIVPTGDPMKPFQLHEFPFSRGLTKQFTLQAGTGFRKAEINGDFRVYFFDRFHTSIEARTQYLFVEPEMGNRFNAEVMFLGGITF